MGTVKTTKCHWDGVTHDLADPTLEIPPTLAIGPGGQKRTIVAIRFSHDGQNVTREGRHQGRRVGTPSPTLRLYVQRRKPTALGSAVVVAELKSREASTRRRREAAEYF